MSDSAEVPLRVALTGSLLGTVAGDALGLPYEGMKAGRAARLLGPPDRHRLVLRRGMVSDDTEHACFVAQALIRSGGEPDRFERGLARSLRWWLTGMPAGIGLATLKSILKLWVGVPTSRSGVFSAGNGPAMRAPLLGVWAGGDMDRLRELVRRSTRMTHTDPKAEQGALAIALAAQAARSTAPHLPDRYLVSLARQLEGTAGQELGELLTAAADSAGRGESTRKFAASLGCEQGISGYMYHTVPCVIQTWLRHADDFEGAIRELIEAGGDTDTTAAIAGGIIGARTGEAGIPQTWLDGIVDWPRSVGWMRSLAVALDGADGNPGKPPGYLVPGLVPRNLAFVLIVLAHGFRRLAPPW